MSLIVKSISPDQQFCLHLDPLEFTVIAFKPLGINIAQWCSRGFQGYPQFGTHDCQETTVRQIAVFFPVCVRFGTSKSQRVRPPQLQDGSRLTFFWPFSYNSFPFFTFSVHPIGFSFCFFSGFLAILSCCHQTTTDVEQDLFFNSHDKQKMITWNKRTLLIHSDWLIKRANLVRK